MVCGLNMQGKIFYAIIIVIYLVMLVYCIYYMITHLLSGDVDSVYLPLNALTILFFCFLFNDSMDYFLLDKKQVFNWSCFYLIIEKIKKSDLSKRKQNYVLLMDKRH